VVVLDEAAMRKVLVVDGGYAGFSATPICSGHRTAQRRSEKVNDSKQSAAT
jgi:hypothetical protein